LHHLPQKWLLIDEPPGIIEEIEILIGGAAA
jgi:hypothetical protein